MNRQQFEDYFAAGKAWTDEHKRLTLAISCFFVGWIVGAIVC